MVEPEQNPAEERRERIATLVGSRGFIGVTELSDLLGVSSVTVRADLDSLVGRGVVRRIRGGAMPIDPQALAERSFEETETESADAKAAIAAEAVRLIAPGMSVLLDVGTTAACVARELLRREDLHDVTVITNGLAIALSLEPAVPRLQVVVTGGTLRPLQHSLVAPLGGLLLEHIHADLALIGCNGVDAVAGITNVNLPEADIKRAMIGAASEVVVIADGSKVGRSRLGKIASVTDVHAIVTDASAPAGPLEELVALRGPRVVVAG
ncbi:transcriptional regulator, DeoR family [Nocardioides terrae]|uniref:Transcriptional regulator, DeoR family n=1 Tax=Nocardioides terrae TaxID=574651 RepID=A0A1I1IMM6_9ACTN|nr:DeoR/GlpR family DNA-binding transcription regulator [Nocardioides terrae]SFC34490.1 transcriptional regulator, DeoR family [Nocardioides terrae]